MILCLSCRCGPGEGSGGRRDPWRHGGGNGVPSRNLWWSYQVRICRLLFETSQGFSSDSLLLSNILGED